MKKLLTLVTTLLLGSLSFAQNYNALRFRQPLAFHQYLIRDLHQQTLERDRSLSEALQKKKLTLQYITDARQRMVSIVGELPERGDLRAQVTGSVQGDGFHVEKIVFQSAQGRYVTAHLYLPDNISRRIPACIEMCGHGLNGKGNGSMLACRMAVNGIAVMVVDPLSQGERLQLHDAQGKPLTRGVTTEHTLIDVPYLLLGSSLAAQEYFDNSRAIDYLLTRSEIDPDRIGAYGFSGGGTQCAYLAALDERVQCACVALFFSSRERTLELIGPSDGCQQMPNEGAQRIEIADMALMMAPKPFIVLDGKYDFVDHWGALRGFDELQRAYTTLGCPERVRQYYAEDGHGAPLDVQQEMVGWFRRWLAEDQSPLVDVAPWQGKEMNCTKSGQVNLEYPDAQSVSDMALAQMQQYADNRKAFLQKDAADVQATLCRYLGITLPSQPIEMVPTGKADLRDITELRFQINREGEMPVPCIVRIPDAATDHSKIQIHLCEQGKAWYLNETDRRDAVSDGTIIIAADLRGIGETSDPYDLNLLKYWNRDYRLSATALHIGRPLMGQRVTDLITLLDFCSQHPQLKDRKIEVVADGVCGPVVTHAALLDSRISSATLTRTLRTWRTYLENPIQHDMLGNVLPGVLRDYDLPDLVRLSNGRVRYGD